MLVSFHLVMVVLPPDHY